MTSSATSMAGGGAKCAAAEVRTMLLCSGVGRLPICLRSLSEETWTHIHKDEFCLIMQNSQEEGIVRSVDTAIAIA